MLASVPQGRSDHLKLAVESLTTRGLATHLLNSLSWRPAWQERHVPSAAHMAQPAPPLQATHLAAAPVPRMYQPLAQAVQRPGVEHTSQELSTEHCTWHGAHSRAGRQLLRLLRCEQALGSAQLAPRQKAREAPGSCYTAVAALPTSRTHLHTLALGHCESVVALGAALGAALAASGRALRGSGGWVGGRANGCEGSSSV
jgi:hypothetical protein